MKQIITILLLVSFLWADGPTTLGSRGLLTVPGAYLYTDGDVVIGYKYSSSHYDHFMADHPDKYAYPKQGIMGAFSFLPFMEISLVYHFEPFQDRLANIRFQIIKEKKILPAITIGLRDALTVLRGINNTDDIGEQKTSYYNSIYMVAGKTLKYTVGIVPQKALIHLGGGYSDFDNSNYQHLHGIFGGIEFTPYARIPASLIAEYDTKSFYFGISGTILDHLWITCSTREFEDFSIVSGVRVNLLKQNRWNKKSNE